MNEATLRDLEYEVVLDSLRASTSTPLGAEAAGRLRPSVDAAEVARRSALTLEAVRHLEVRGGLPFGTLTDPAPLLEHLEVEGSECGPLEIQELLAVMKAGREVKASLAMAREAFPRLWEEARGLPDLGNLIRFLDGKIGPRGEILDHASEDLLALRREIRRAGSRLEDLLKAIVARPEVSRALQDDFVALRSDRHVIPIRAESRQSLAGIVHGLSGTGATVFIEPMETVELNNEIVTLREREAAEVRRLLREYSDLLRGRRAEIRGLAEGLGRLDLALARARLGRAMRGIAADPSPTGALRLRGARHPLVEASLRARGAAIVPLDLDLPADRTVLVVSGPNTGGKTVALKTLGLLTLMHQAGLLVPAREAALPIVESVFIDIGDRQSIRERLSTFSARIGAIASMAGALTLPALVLLDEIGTGTDPEDGVALGIAIVDYFRRRGARVIVSTHLEALKAYAAITPDCANAAMQFDETTGEPNYRLVQGIAGRSSALAIAARLGLPGEVLEDARARRGSSARLLEEYLARLERMGSDLAARLDEVAGERAALAAERADFETSLREREERQRAGLAAEITTALASMREAGERYLAGLRDQEIAHRLRRDEAREGARLRGEARRLIRAVAPRHAEAAGATIEAGARVHVRGMGPGGVVQEVQGGKVVLLVRGKRLVVPREDCEPVDALPADPAAARRPALPRGVTLSRREDAGPVDSVDLRGLAVEEALERLDKSLDDASVEGLDRVRVIHGVGSGRLRRALRERLRDHPQVEAWRPAAEDEGGEGATWVTLRG